MSSSLRRGALAAAAIAFSIASLSACAAGHNAQTLEVQPDNASTTVGDIKIQNAVVITQPDLESTGPAVVSATLFNEGRTDQTLESVTVPGTGKTAELTPAEGGSLTVPAGGSLVLGGEGNAAAVLSSSREAVRDGNAQKVTFTFSRTGDVSLRAYVFPAEHFFEEWGPTEAAAAPGASAEPSAESSGAPAAAAPGASAEPSAESSGAPAADATDEAADTGESTDTGAESDTGAGSGTPTDAASASASAGH